MAHVNTARRGTGAVALLALLMLSACAEGNDSSSSQDASGVPVQSNPPSGDHTLTGGAQGGGEATADSTPAPQPGEGQGPVVVPDTPTARQLVIKMTVGIEVASVSAAVDKVVALAETHGGRLYNSNLDLTDDTTASGDLVFKLPPDEAQPFISGLDKGIGRRTGLQGTTDDVTRQLTDLDSQILTAHASVERVRAMLSGAKDLGEVVALEGELTTRETHLEQLLAQRADLGGQVALATVTVHLTAAPAAATPAAAEKPKGVGAAFSKGWEAFVAVLLAIALFVGYTAPFLVMGGLALLVMWRVNRRRASAPRSRSAAPPPPPAPDEGPRTSAPDSAAGARIP
jgi:hypothetical protein